jgi:UDP-N-acetylglucosamine acyltransferase
MTIHPTAVIHKNTKIAGDVEIGPYTIIGENVQIGKGCKIFSHAVIGTQCQDLKYKGERAFVKIGENTVIREFVTINYATGEGEETVVGSNCLLMAYVHVAHNCKVGNNVVIANAGTLAGHVEIEDKAIIGGLTAIHQFCKIGSLSITGGCSKVVQDIPPYMLSDGHPAQSHSINAIGLRRNNVPEETRLNLKKAFKIIFRSGLSTLSAIDKIQSEIPSSLEISHLVDFIKNSKRGIC